jgi:hypothetical protein
LYKLQAPQYLDPPLVVAYTYFNMVFINILNFCKIHYGRSSIICNISALIGLRTSERTFLSNAPDFRKVNAELSLFTP